MSESSERADRPSDLELMSYFDGELEPERIAAVERFLASNGAARKKVQGLSLGGAMLREQCLASATAADGIADALMKVIAAGDTEAKRSAEQIAVAPMGLPPARAANDNRRRIFGFAGLAVAAAAALFVWGRAGQDGALGPSVHSVAEGTVAEVTAPAPSAAPSGATARPAGSADDENGASEADPVHGVEVASVEFGAQMGSVFYVPSEGGIATTTVVWLAEEAGEE